MTPVHVTIFGYSLNWWMAAVIVPVGLGIRWYLEHRQSATEALIENQSNAILQLSSLNGLLMQQRVMLEKQVQDGQNRMDTMQQKMDALEIRVGQYEAQAGEATEK